jgi:hypothetical protein
MEENMKTYVTWFAAGMILALIVQQNSQGQGRSAEHRDAAQQRRTQRVAERIAREPNPRANGAASRDHLLRGSERGRNRREETSPEETRRAQSELIRRNSANTGRDNALQRELAAIDRLRDQALLSGDERLLDRANALEQQIHQRSARLEDLAPHSRGFGRFSTGPLNEPTGDPTLKPEKPTFERGLGRETARQVRGLELLPENEHELGAPGFGRRTAAERRYLRGQEPRGPWDAQFWPQPQEPGGTGQTPSGTGAETGITLGAESTPQPPVAGESTSLERLP